MAKKNIDCSKVIHKSTIIIIALATILVTTTITSIITTSENTFAYTKDQAKSDINECGNGQVLTNIGCQNIDSQIQGDENSVALTAQQTFPEPGPPETCEECFTRFLNEAEIAAFEQQLKLLTAVDTVEELCAFLENIADSFPDAIPGNIATIGQVLVAADIEEPTIQEILDCLRTIFGVGA